MFERCPSSSTATSGLPFWKAYGLTFICPARGFDALSARHPLRRGALAVGIAAVNYSLVYFYLGTIDQRTYEDAMSVPGTGPNYLINTLILVYLFAFLTLFTLGVSRAHRPTRLKAFASSTVGVLIYGLVFVHFNR